MKTKILFFVLIIAHNLQALEVTTKLNMTGNNYGIVKQGTLYYTQGGLDVGYTTDQTISRGYVEFSLANIPTYATITSAQLHLQAFQKYISVATKSTILIKGITNWTLAGLAPEGAWTALNSSTTTLYNNAINYYDAIDLTGTALINYISARKGNNVGLGIINKYETTDGIAFSTDPLDLYLSVKYTITVPSIPSELVVSNINTTSCNLSWTETSGKSKGYNVYNNGVLIGSSKNKTYSASGLTSASNNIFTVSSFNEAGETSQSSAIGVLTKPLSPTNLSASTSCGSTSLSWLGSTGQISGYKVYKNNVLLTTTTNLNAQIDNLTASTQYTFSVSSYNESGESDKSNVAISTSTMPSSPTNAVIRYFVSPGPGYVLTWTASSTTVKGYHIYQQSPPMGLIATTTYSSYVLGTSFQPNQTFMYGVCAYDENGCESPLATTGFSSMQKQKVKANNLISSDINSQAELNLYPNPVVNKLYIDGISQTFDVVVTNLQGQIIKSETKLSNSIDLSELRSGVYIIKIKYDKTEIIRRIIKQ